MVGTWERENSDVGWDWVKQCGGGGGGGTWGKVNNVRWDRVKAASLSQN